MAKLDESKVQYILRKHRKGVSTSEIAEEMNVSPRWIRKLCARYKDVDLKDVVYPIPRGRPPNGMPGRKEHSAVLTYRQAIHLGADELEGVIEEATGIHIPHNTIHAILKSEGLANTESKKGGKRKWVRYERTYSNSMWHTDYKQLSDGRWFLSYEDDASRFVTGYGVFENATTQNALKVLDEAIKHHGKPASIMTDHGSQFYANEAEARKRGESEFEKRLVELDIKQILARIKHPQTNGKLERIHGEIQRKLPEFEAILMRTSDPIDLFMKWYNYDRPHRSLDFDKLETPWEGVVHGLLQTAYLITKTDCSRCLEWPLAAITGSFRHPAGVFSCRLGRENRPKLASACLIRRRCAASPACLGCASDLYSPGAVRPRYCGILRRLQARVPACGGSRTGHNSAT